LISTVFAPHAGNRVSDETFSRLATLADELDAGIQMDLHASAAEMEECAALYGMRPIERLRKLGLLTPALNAVHMAHASAADIELARRTGISISLCPQSNLRSGALPPVAALAAAGVQLGLGSAGAASLSQGVWGEMKLTALLSLTPWDVLCSATRGGAAALGIADEVGTLETGKSADLCCIDLSGPAAQPPQDPLTQLVFNGGRDIVGDVWVAGRQLLAGGELCRLDWSAAAASFGAKYA